MYTAIVRILSACTSNFMRTFQKSEIAPNSLTRAFSSSNFSNFGISLPASMGAIHKMAPVGVCGALLHTGPCWMYGWLRAAEKDSPSESYFLLLLLEYAQGDTYR